MMSDDGYNNAIFNVYLVRTFEEVATYQED